MCFFAFVLSIGFSGSFPRSYVTLVTTLCHIWSAAVALGFVAALFLVSYAGHGYYGLYEKHTAFALMALSTLIGAAVAMRGKLVSIAVLSLLGGLIAPAVLHGDSNLVTPFLAYLLMLQVVALVLSW